MKFRSICVCLLTSLYLTYKNNLAWRSLFKLYVYLDRRPDFRNADRVKHIEHCFFQMSMYRLGLITRRYVFKRFQFMLVVVGTSFSDNFFTHFPRNTVKKRLRNPRRIFRLMCQIKYKFLTLNMYWILPPEIRIETTPNLHQFTAFFL